MHTHQTNLLILFPWEIYSNVILCRCVRIVCDIECGAWVGLLFYSTHSLIHLLTLWFWVNSCRVAFHWFPSLVRICYFAKLKTSAKNTLHTYKPSTDTKVFLRNVCVCVSTENWLKCSDIVWIMSIDKSSLLFVVFLPYRLFSLFPFISFHLVFFFWQSIEQGSQQYYKLSMFRMV